MTYHGTVKNGTVQLEPGAKLPEGTKVEVRIVSPKEPPLQKYARLARRTGLPSDLSLQHDHYIHGTPKK